MVNATISPTRAAREQTAPGNLRTNGPAMDIDPSPANATMIESAAKTPTISVLMPVYNAAAHLREAMDSILGQSFGDFEFLCVDDGSTDNSPALLREYAARDPRVIVLTKPTGGVTSALNAGLTIARGEFVARMDADDVADPQRFEAQIEHMRANADVVAVGCRVTHMTTKGVDISLSPLYATHEQIAECLWNGNSSAMPHFGSFMRRGALTQIGNYREEFRTAQDLDLFLRLSEIGKLGNVPCSLMRYRVHEGSVGARKADEQARNAREIIRQAYERRGMKLPPSREMEEPRRRPQPPALGLAGVGGGTIRRRPRPRLVRPVSSPVQAAKLEARVPRPARPLAAPARTMVRRARRATPGRLRKNASTEQSKWGWAMTSALEKLDAAHSLAPVLGGEGGGEGPGGATCAISQNGPSPQPSPPSTGEREQEHDRPRMRGLQPMREFAALPTLHSALCTLQLFLPFPSSCRSTTRPVISPPPSTACWHRRSPISRSSQSMTAQKTAPSTSFNNYAARDPRIRVVSRPNTGIVGALNDGLALARAEFVARMDGDDVCLPDRFEKQVAYLREHADCVLVGRQVMLIDP